MKKIIIIMSLMILTGCKSSKDMSKVYPHCLKYQPTPSITYEEYIKDNRKYLWKHKGKWGVIAWMQFINIDYPTKEWVYLEELKNRKLISDYDYNWIKTNGMKYMPRKKK